MWQEADALVGDFTMRIMVLAGRGEGNSPIYAGIEVVVGARMAVEFATSLRDFILSVGAELATEQPQSAVLTFDPASE